MPGISRSFLNLYRDRSHDYEYFSGWSDAQIAEATLYVASLSAAAMGRRRMMSSVRSTALSYSLSVMEIIPASDPGPRRFQPLKTDPSLAER